MASHASDGLPPDEIIRRVEKALRLGGGTHEWEDVRIKLMEGRMQLFWNDHGVCITEVVQAPQCRFLNAFVVAGELPGVMDLHDEVERHAITQGCKFMTTSARKGWKKVLPAYGWKDSRTVFVRDLTGVSYG